MSKVIDFPIGIENREYSAGDFEWFIGRMHDYIDFLNEKALDKDKSEWCKKFIAALKFLGDYKLEDDLKE